MAESDVVEYRLPSARAVVVVGVIAVAVMTVLAALVPSRELAPAIPVVVLGAWLAMVLWSLPLLRVTRSEIQVRNSLHSVTIPLAAVAEVTSGKRLTIRTHGRRTYIPAAVPGNGAFLMGAVRQANTYGAGPVPLLRVDRLRMDSEGERSPSAVIARTIRRRIDLLDDDDRRSSLNPDGTVCDTPPPKLNVDVIAWTMVVAILCAGLFFVLG